MKTKNLQIILATAIIAVFFISCSKDEDPVTPAPAATPVVATPTNTDLLCTGVWYVRDMEHKDVATGVTTNIFSLLSACDLDDFDSFTSNLQCVADEGATKCVATDPQTENGTWSWASSETILNINYPSEGPTAYSLVSLTSLYLVLSFNDGIDEYKLTLGH